MPALAVVGWFATLKPSNDRDWTPDVARAPWAEIDGDLVTTKSATSPGAWETDFTEHWETRTVDLAKLEGVDLIGSYWDGRRHRPRDGELRVPGRAGARDLDRDQKGRWASPIRPSNT